MSAHLQAHRSLIATPPPLTASGRLVRVSGLVMEASGLRLPLGSVCVVRDGEHTSEAEVVGFSREHLFLMPTGDLNGLSPGACVEPVRYPLERLHYGSDLPDRPRKESHTRRLPMGEGLLGRVVDPAGQPLDGGPPLYQTRMQPIVREPLNAMDRDPVRQPLDVGVRAINSILTVGRGQRLGLFAGSGVGKSVLLGMMARHTQADVIIVGLIGERGREVKEFVEDILGARGPQPCHRGGQPPPTCRH